MASSTSCSHQTTSTKHTMEAAAEQAPPHFFKIILQSTILEGKLSVPPAFVRKYGNAIKSPVILMTPRGTTWSVELSKHDGEVLLDKGWRSFAEYHSIEYGHFLVFRYQGGNRFHVLVFDKSATEIAYPPSNRETSEEPTANGTCAEFMGDSSPCEGTRQKSQVQHTLPGASRLLGDEKNVDAQTRGDRSNSGPSLAIQVENDVSKHPSYKITILQNHLESHVEVPYCFTEKYIKDQPDIITLCVGKRSWPARFTSDRSHRWSQFSVGWPLFARMNSLRAGDVCEFVLGGKNTMHITIFRHSH